MALEAAQHQHIEWLREQLAQRESQLADAKALVAQLQESTDYFRSMLAFLAPEQSESASQAMNGKQSELNSCFAQDEDQNGSVATSSTVSDDKDIENKNPEGEEGEEENKRNPKQMLCSSYVGMTLGDAAEAILNGFQSALNADDIAQIMFDVQDEEEYTRARNSLSTELRRGAKEGRWRKVGRGSFSSNLVNKESESETLNIAEQVRMPSMLSMNSAETLDS